MCPHRTPPPPVYVIHSRNNGGGAGVMAAGDRPASPAILNGGTRDASSDHECGGALATAPFNESTLSLSLMVYGAVEAGGGSGGQRTLILGVSASAKQTNAEHSKTKQQLYKYKKVQK
jgi:hypothetical protein